MKLITAIILIYSSVAFSQDIRCYVRTTNDSIYVFERMRGTKGDFVGYEGEEKVKIKSDSVLAATYERKPSASDTVPFVQIVYRNLALKTTINSGTSLQQYQVTEGGAPFHVLYARGSRMIIGAGTDASPNSMSSGVGSDIIYLVKGEKAYMISAYMKKEKRDEGYRTILDTFSKEDEEFVRIIKDLSDVKLGQGAKFRRLWGELRMKYFNERYKEL